MSEKQKWYVVVLYAIAMAWVEAAVVVYLRTLINRLVPYQPDPLPNLGAFGGIELVREFATLVMLLTVGGLAGRTWRSRAGYAVIAFGIWDIFYYLFLVPTSGWPASVWDWDILFLIPLPWWGPVIAPISISLLLILGGTLVSQYDTPTRPVLPGRWTILTATLGALCALYAFMQDALRVSSAGTQAVLNTLPTSFNWIAFLLGLALMALPVIDVARRVFWASPPSFLQIASTDTHRQN